MELHGIMNDGNLWDKSINSKIGIIESGLYTRVNPVKNVYNSYIFNEVYV